MNRITIEWLAGMVAEALIARGVETTREQEHREIEHWLAEVTREAQIEALREAGRAIRLVILTDRSDNPLHLDDCATAAAQGWLVGRANRIEGTE